MRHGEQVTVELVGRRQKTGADYVVDWFEHPQISRHGPRRWYSSAFVPRLDRHPCPAGART